MPDKSHFIEIPVVPTREALAAKAKIPEPRRSEMKAALREKLAFKSDEDKAKVWFDAVLLLIGARSRAAAIAEEANLLQELLKEQYGINVCCRDITGLQIPFHFIAGMPAGWYSLEPAADYHSPKEWETIERVDPPPRYQPPQEGTTTGRMSPVIQDKEGNDVLANMQKVPKE